MEQTSHSRGGQAPAFDAPPAGSHAPAALPWSGLLTLTLAVFVVVSGEMMPTAVLPVLAADLDVSVAQAGLLVSAWAATVVVASFPLARLTARFDRSTVIAVALVVFSGATLATAWAGTYGLAMGSRLVAAAATGLLWSTVNTYAASIVPEHRIARATAIVLFGGTLGTVAAVPAGNAAAALWGWRVPFVVLALLGLATALAVHVVLRRTRVVDVSAPGTPGTGSTVVAPRRQLRPVFVIGALGGLILVAHFAAFTFVAELVLPSAVPTPALLLVFGLVSASGVVLVGATSDRFPSGTPVVMAAVVAVSLIGLVLLGRHGGVDIGLVVLWGVATGAVGPAVQVAMMRAAGPEHRSTAGTLMPVAMNLGIAVGAALGSGVVDRWSVEVLPVVAAVPAVFATVGFLAVARATRLSRAPGPILGPTATHEP
ncbi:MFS transporter [Georgenia halophila]|uniref:MFS transporter n=1 Tax=Georgenia halophila TaxID=620889 RepID=A0ABP8LPA7_9MICO